MNPINLIQNYRENYSVMNVPRNLKDEIHIFNLKRKITDEELDIVKNVIGFESANFTGIKNSYLKFNMKRKITNEELSSILKKRTEKLREANEILKQKIKLMEIEERIKKEELAEAECTYESCWHNTLKGKELEEAKEAYERSEV